MTAPTESQQLQWITQWRRAAIALEEVRLQELQTADLARIASDLEDACLEAVRSAEPSVTSGLVEQQRILHSGR